MKKEIANVLRAKGSKSCLEKAEKLENESISIAALYLRDLELNADDLIAISKCFNQSLKTISFSYNKLIGDKGIIFLIKNLPKSVSELGLVDCGINDKGGIEILNWIKNSGNIKMVCMEQNNFSDKLCLEFHTFKNNNPQLVFIF